MHERFLSEALPLPGGRRGGLQESQDTRRFERLHRELVGSGASLPRPASLDVVAADSGSPVGPSLTRTGWRGSPASIR